MTLDTAPDDESPETTTRPTRVTTSRPRRLNPAALLLLPSFLIVSIFVYGFIAYTVRVSFAKNWQPANPDFATNDPWYATYEELAHSPRFQADVRNNIVFTVLFLILSVIAGLVLAILIHRVLFAKGFFRGLFLLPYALSFIVTGVVWRWMFNPISGINLLLRNSGVSGAYESMTGTPLQPDWVSSPDVVGDVSGILETAIPGGDFIQMKMGIPLALVAVVFAASWQLMGFAMAMFLAGLASIPEEIHEAAMMDGATGLRYYRSVALPLLKPMAVTAIVILAHVAFKMFDLVYAMSGSGVGFATDMPGTFVYETMYRALRPDLGSAAAMVMLFLVCAVVVPYLARRGSDSYND